MTVTDGIYIAGHSHNICTQGYSPEKEGMSEHRKSIALRSESFRPTVVAPIGGVSGLHARSSDLSPTAIDFPSRNDISLSGQLFLPVDVCVNTLVGHQSVTYSSGICRGFSPRSLYVRHRKVIKSSLFMQPCFHNHTVRIL